MQIELSLIKPSPHPLRSSWDEDKMQELTISIKRAGLVVPIKVRPDNGTYEIVYGHRRVEACRRAQLDAIDAIIEGMEDPEARTQGLIENIQREDMVALDIAKGLQELKDETGWSNRRIAEHMGWASDGNVHNYLSMLRPQIVEVLERTQHAALSQKQVLEARAGAGRDDLAGMALEKAAKDQLAPKDTRLVAEALAHAEDEAEREAILSTDPRDRAFDQLVRAKAHVKRKAEKEAKKKRQEDDREVRAYLDAIRTFRAACQEAAAVAKYGKFSPEAARFVVRQHELLVEDLENLELALEVKNG